MHPEDIEDVLMRALRAELERAKRLPLVPRPGRVACESTGMGRWIDVPPG
jgi:hypothetical protein